MSELSRSCIRDGDTTTAGGRVEAKPQQWPVTYGDQHAAFEGDPVWCPACKSHGVTKCVPPLRPNTGPDGRQKNLDGDLCLCKCPTSPRLVARFNNVRVGFSSDEAARMAGSGAWLAYAGHAQASNTYDEQVHLGTAGAGVVAGLPYFVEVADGRTISGRADETGELPRIETDAAAEYTVYWGDEALAMMEGIEE